MADLPVGLYRRTPGENGRFVAANQTIAKLLGYDSVEDFVKLEAPDVYLDIDDLRKFSRRLLAEEQVAGVELRLRKRREEDIQTDWLYVPSTQVGGGALGYHWIDNTHFIYYLLDVSGHGVAAALVSVSVLNTL